MSPQEGLLFKNKKSKLRYEEGLEEASEAERNTICILGSIAKLERQQQMPNQPAAQERTPIYCSGYPGQLSAGCGFAKWPSEERAQVQEESAELERTAADVFVDRAPSGIDMELLWKMQAAHYKEFASHLYDDSGATKEFETVPSTYAGRRSEKGQRLGSCSEQVKGSRKDGYQGAPSNQACGKREGPSRKSLRKAKKRMLESGPSTDSLPHFDQLEGSTDVSREALQSVQGRPLSEHCLGPLSDCRDKQAEGSELAQSQPAASAGRLPLTKPKLSNTFNKQGDNEGQTRTSSEPPSHVLYVKNLDKSVVESDLLDLFDGLSKAGKKPLSLRVMKQGRMKGQAFLTFPGNDYIPTAQDALKSLNGKLLRGRHLVLEFGRSGC